MDQLAEFAALGAEFGLNMRVLVVPGSQEAALGEATGGAGSYGLDAVLRFRSSTGRYTGRGGVAVGTNELRKYLEIWQEHKDWHPMSLEAELRRHKTP